MSAGELRCSECGATMDERYHTVWRQVIGWERKRAAGGTNHVALRSPQEIFMCNSCMLRKQAGLDPRQQSLI